MKRYCASVLALALLGGTLAFAQDYFQGAAEAPGIPLGKEGGLPVPPGTHRQDLVCTPTHTTKKVEKITYSAGAEAICPCFFHGLFCHGCADGHCDRPVIRHYLIKKVRDCPEDKVKCVPTWAPGCSHGQCYAGGGAAAEGIAPSAPGMVGPGMIPDVPGRVAPGTMPYGEPVAAPQMPTAPPRY